MMNSSKSPNFRYFKSTTYKGKVHSMQDVKNDTKRSKHTKTRTRTRTRTRSLKKQIRDTQRLLFKKILDEEALIAQQQKLQRLKRAQREEKRFKIRSKRVKKYRGVKYFDSKKVLKKLTSLTKLTDSGPISDVDKDKLGTELTLYKRYLNYITYFPDEKKYLSLFPNSERLDPDAQNQIDALIREINSKVMEGLYADSWSARLATTNATLHPSLQQTVSSEEETSPTRMGGSDSDTDLEIDSNSADFIPIEVEHRLAKETPDNIKKRNSGEKKSLKAENLISKDASNMIGPPPNYTTSQMEFEDSLKSDNFFFFDNKGSEVDTSLFSRRPQKRNFQENRNREDKLSNSKQQSEYRQSKKRHNH